MLGIPHWVIFALLAAVTAALTNIFAKIGMKGIDSTFATAVRATVSMIFLVGLATALGKWPHLKTLNRKAFIMIVLAGVAGGTSWLCGYRALSYDVPGGNAAKVAALDKLSVPLAVVLAVLILGDQLAAINWLGVMLIVLGAYLVAYKAKGS